MDAIDRFFARMLAFLGVLFGSVIAAVIIACLLGIKDGGGIFMLILIINVGFWVWVFHRRDAQRRAEEYEAEQALAVQRSIERKADVAYKRWAANRALVPCEEIGGLATGLDEVVYFRESNVELYEAATQSMSTTSGTFDSFTYVGDSFAVGGGDLQAATVQHQWEEQKCKATGVLFITNKRLAFVSDMQTRSVPWKSVMSCSSRGRFLLSLCVEGINVAQNFHAVGARIYAEAGRMIRRRVLELEHVQRTLEMQARQVGHAVDMEESMLQVQCPHCGEALDIPESVADGQHIECPYCSQKFAFSDDLA